MSVFRRRRGHPLVAVFSAAADGLYFTDDAKTSAYYFDDALTQRYVTQDA